MGRFLNGVAAAAVTGVVSAVVTRLLMRAVALITDLDPGFDLAGSTGIAVIYVAFLLPGCVALACSRARWPWFLFLAGAGVLLFEAVVIGLEETSAAPGLDPVRWVLLLAALGAMLATYVTHFVVAARWSRRRIFHAAADRRPRTEVSPTPRSPRVQPGSP